MKATVLFAILLSVLTLSAFDLTPYKRIVCFGDSITHGGYYPMFLQEYLAETDPETPRRIINRGISGDTTGNLLGRVNSMLKKDQPDLVIIMIGTNDLLNSGKFAEKDLPFEVAVKKYPVFGRFEKNLGKLLDIFKQANIPVVLLATPPYNESANPEIKSPVKANLNSSGVKHLQVVERRLAEIKGAVWIDIYTPLLKNLHENDAKLPRGKKDRVHPSWQEHLIIARTILGKPYKQGKKAAAAQKYRNVQKKIQTLHWRLARLPKGCTTPEARVAFYKNKVPAEMLESLKDPDTKLKELDQASDAVFLNLYRK